MRDTRSDFEPPLRVQASDGARIQSVDDWQALAAPAGGAAQWKVGRSAYELANAWVGDGRLGVPDELVALLESAPETASFAAGLARPEAKIALDTYRGNTRNADLLLHGGAAGGPTLVTVEAKADEPFGNHVGDELRRVIDKPASNLPKRIAALSELLFGDGAECRDLRYQLLHGLGATVLEAQRRNVDQAVFVIHEFRTSSTNDAKHAANHKDLRTFMASFAVEHVTPGRLQRVTVAGAPDVAAFVGLVTTDTRHRP